MRLHHPAQLRVRVHKAAVGRSDQQVELTRSGGNLDHIANVRRSGALAEAGPAELREVWLVIEIAQPVAPYISRRASDPGEACEYDAHAVQPGHPVPPVEAKGRAHQLFDGNGELPLQAGHAPPDA
jgi:hypothetical protein